MTGSRILWVSTSTETRGGVATYVRTMQGTPLWQKWAVRHVATHRDGSAVLRVSTFLTGTASFLRELGLRRPAVVHLHMASYGSFARKSTLAWTSRFAGVPVIVHVHGAAFEQFYAGSPRLLQNYIRSTLENADAVIALGQNWARALSRIAPAARVVVVPNAVRPRAPVRQPRTGERVQVLFLGEIEERKGAFLLLDAWSRLGPGAPGGVAANLVMAGGGAVARARTMVEELDLSEQVTVTGWVDPAEVEHLLAKSHVLVLSSTAEGQPMAVLEAMAHGLCVVATDVGGVAELVGDDGVLLRPGDRPGLVTALEVVIRDSEYRSELAARAHRRLKEKFDVDKTWRALDALYEELRR